MRGWTRWCTIGLVLLFALGACGDDDDSGDTAGGDSDASESTVETTSAPNDAATTTVPETETERPSTAAGVAVAFVERAIDDGDVGDLVSPDVAGNDPLWGKAEELRRLAQATPSAVEPGDISSYGFPADPASSACSTDGRDAHCAVDLPGLGMVTLVTLTASSGGPTFAVTGLDYDVPNQLEDGSASASEQFVSPSGNIACRIDADAASCEIADYDFEPPARPAECGLDWGGRVVVGSVEATFSCHGDTLFNSDAPTLSYGASSTVGDYTCASAEDGMTCTHTPTGHGFQIRRASYQLF